MSIKFQLTPDIKEYLKSRDCPIDSMNISEVLQTAGIDVAVHVEHTTGELTIIDKKGILNVTKINTLKNLIRSMPQYMNDL